MSKSSKAISLFLALSILGACDLPEEQLIAEVSSQKSRAEQVQFKENARQRAEAAEQERLKAEAEEKKKKEEQARKNVVTFVVAGLATVVSGGKSQKAAAPAGDTFAARNAAMNATYDRTRYRIASGTRSPGADAPASGTAVYKGNANIKTDQQSLNSFAIGQAQIDADFTQNTISGRIDNFLDPSDAALKGSIALSNGKITRADRPNDAWTDDRISADLSGDLDVSGSLTTVNGSMSGSFREGQFPESIIPPGRYITGNIGLTTGGSVPLFGGFTVTRQ